MDNQVNLNFHSGFKPEKQYISSILSVADTTEPMSVQDISAYTGIPNGKSTGKVLPHINYAKYMGLIDVDRENGKINLKKTKLGNMVSIEDPGLQEELTILLCHAMLLSPNSDASVWKCIFNDILPSYSGKVDKDTLIKSVGNILGNKVNTRNMSPFWGAYDEMFSCLGILNISNEIVAINAVQYNREYIYVYAMVLFEFWDNMYVEQTEISESQFSAMKIKNIFGWNEQQEYEMLEHLNDKGIIRLNRQLVPYTILKLADKDAMIEKLYSELF